jgi:hypothetical protein
MNHFCYSKISMCAITFSLYLYTSFNRWMCSVVVVFLSSPPPNFTRNFRLTSCLILILVMNPAEQHV